MLELYQNIKNKRIELNMTQEELAAKLGYQGKSMICKIEKGLVDLPQSKIEAFAKALGTTPAYLMGWEEAEAAGREAGQKIIDARSNNAMQDFFELTDNDREIIIGMIERLRNATD